MAATDERTPLLELEAVSRVFGEQVKVYALRTVSLQIYGADHMAIVGPSGSGKSTMLGLLGVLDLPTEGTIRIADQDVTVLEDADRSRLRGDTIGFVFQQFHLIPHLTALGNVMTALLYRGLTTSERRDRAVAALERVGLGARAEHRPVQMSGGEQQRVAIARAIVTDPLIVLADEPTGALDTRNAAMVMEVFAGLGSSERAVVVVTHDLGVAATANRVVHMRDGEIDSDTYQTPTPFRGISNVKNWRELLGVAWSGLSSRKIRTLLIMLGPIVGVAAMVGAVGLTESAKGDLKEKLAALGTNLITVEAGGSFGSTEPDDAQGRSAPREAPRQRDARVCRRRGDRSADDPPPGSREVLRGVPRARARVRLGSPARARGQDAERALAARERPSGSQPRGRHREGAREGVRRDPG